MRRQIGIRILAQKAFSRRLEGLDGLVWEEGGWLECGWLEDGWKWAVVKDTEGSACVRLRKKKFVGAIVRTLSW